MTFLQPLLLFALPLIALPILIHLINQNRYRTVNWAATMFLLQAKRMARGMARLRYLLILFARMLAIAGLILAVSRPMAGGWLGLTQGGAPELTLIILDRSSSMEQQDGVSGLSKRQTALEKLSAALRDSGRATRLVVIESGNGQHFELPVGASLSDLPEASPTATAADMPALVQTAVDLISASETGRTDVWICSDLRSSDWSPGSGRWNAIRQELSEREGVRVYLLAYPDGAPENLSVSVSGVHRRETTDGAELVMDLKVVRETPADTAIRVPVSLVINGARSTIDLELTGSQHVRNGHTVPIDRESRRGWGRVELPRDSNSADNTWQFVYAEPAVRKSVIVSDDAEVMEPLRIAAATGADRSLTYEAAIVSPSAVDTIDWQNTAAVFWHGVLPSGAAADQVKAFVQRGGSVMFFPPETPDETTLFGMKWSQWQQTEDDQSWAISRWRTDSDLFSNTLAGSPLPAGQLAVFRACGLAGDTATTLAQLNEGPPLLLRANQDQGGVWFCTTLPSTTHSNLVTNGIVFYVMVQRAVSRGAAALGAARQLDCGPYAASEATTWKPLDELSEGVLISQRTLLPGLYGGDEVQLALNRPIEEDITEVLSKDAVDQLFSGLNFTRIDDTAGSATALASEVWQTFLIIMLVALIAEALLCVPEKR